MAPLLFLVILGIIEFGRAMMVQQILSNGTREGARRAVLANSTQSEVTSVIDGYLSSCGISGYTTTCTNVGTAQAGDPITVAISIPYSQVSWLPTGSLQWLGSTSISATVIMRKEANNN